MAIVIDRRIYCHMPKTGGDFITRYLREDWQGKDPPGMHGHAAYDDFPKKWTEDREPFGSIRDPWSWYASWWMHASSVCLEQGGLQKYGAGSKSFKAVLAGVLMPSDMNTPNNVGLIWSHDVKRTRPSFLRQKVGLYTWTFRHVFSGKVHTFIDTPQIYDGLEQLLGQPVNRHLHPPRNTREQRSKSAVKDVSTLYTQEMIDAVWKADGALIEQLGFTEPFKPHDSAIIRI